MELGAAARGLNLQEDVIDRFAEETDDQGDLKYPHFEDVRAVMSGLVQADEKMTMENAYANAVYAFEPLRDRLLADQRVVANKEAETVRTAAVKKAESEKAAKAKEAKRAAAGVKSTPAPQTPAEQKDVPLRDMVSEVYDQVSSSP